VKNIWNWQQMAAQFNFTVPSRQQKSLATPAEIQLLSRLL